MIIITTTATITITTTTRNGSTTIISRRINDSYDRSQEFSKSL
jgi:hypothetical protein